MNYTDGCYPLLELGDEYRRGLLIYERLRAGKLKGRVACHRESVGVICQVASLGAGTHLEIGSLFGATAIAALLAKRTGNVHCIDPLDGYYGLAKDPICGFSPSVEILKQNFETFGLADRAVITAAYSDPWPLPDDITFDTCLIDGDHSEKGARADWLNVKDRVQKYVIFDNVDTKHPGVVAVFKEACADPNWLPVLVYDIVGVVKRVGNS